VQPVFIAAIFKPLYQMDNSLSFIIKANQFITPKSKNKTPKLNYHEATNYYQGLKTQNKPFGKRKKNKI
jgi:hypothetical protein